MMVCKYDGSILWYVNVAKIVNRHSRSEVKEQGKFWIQEYFPIQCGFVNNNSKSNQTKPVNNYIALTTRYCYKCLTNMSTHPHCEAGATVSPVAQWNNSREKENHFHKFTQPASRAFTQAAGFGNFAWHDYPVKWPSGRVLTSLLWNVWQMKFLFV